TSALARPLTATWAYRRLLQRADEPALAALFRAVRDERLLTVYAVAADRGGTVGEHLLENELVTAPLPARRPALAALAMCGPLARRPAFLDAVATHRVGWPAGNPPDPAHRGAALAALGS